MTSTTKYEIMSKSELRDRIKEFEGAIPWLQMFIDRINYYKVKFYNDYAIRKAIENYSLETPLSPFENYLSDLMQIFCESYSSCDLYTIEYLHDIQHIFEIIPDDVFKMCIIKSLKKWPTFTIFDTTLREILNNNVALKHREDEDIIENNTFKEDIDKVLKMLEASPKIIIR
jgi:hypothetical protein